jgi:hypothetical protein
MPRNREENWKHEAQDAVRREIFTQSGPTRPIKVVVSGRALTHATGFFMIGISIVNHKPAEIAAAAGLPPHDYANGARIYKLKRIPFVSEYTYELSAKHPDGLAYVEAMSDPNYKPGDPSLHQWCLRKGVQIAVLPQFLDLGPSDSMPYDWLMHD